MRHMGAKSPIGPYKADMAADVKALTDQGVALEAAWLQVATAKIQELADERDRIEILANNAYAATKAGKRAGFKIIEAEPSPQAEATGEPDGRQELQGQGQGRREEEVAPAAPVAAPTPSANTIFTEDAAAAARARLKAKLGRLSSGIDPEMLLDGITLAGYHIERGARKFAAYAKAMVEDLGDAVKPYLVSWYLAVRNDPRAAGFKSDMDRAADVEDADIDALLRKAAGTEEQSAPRLDTAPGRAAIASRIADRLTTGGTFQTIVEARKFIADATGQKIEPATQAAKLADEAIELGVVMAARRIVAEGRAAGEADAAIFDKLVTLYAAQPNLSTRSSTSVREQAYSTPAPLAFVASRLAGIKPGDRVGEPTAGNGMLLVEVDPRNAVVNELNADRAANLAELQFEPTSRNAATTDLADAKSLDAEVMNPPFGAVKDDNRQTVYFDITDNYRTREIDHAIAFKALEALKNNGRAVLILGGVDATTEEQIRDGYRGAGKREFYFNLYRQYRVTDHFTIDGDLYSRQGAAYPVDVVVIEGRGPSSRDLPAADLPARLTTWDQVKEKLNEASRVAPAGNRPGTDGRTGAATSPTGRPGLVEGAVGPDQRTGGEGEGPRTGGTASGAGAGDAGPGGRGAGGAVSGPAQPGSANAAGPAGAGAQGPVPSPRTQRGARGGASARGNEPVGVGRPGGSPAERLESGLEDRRGQEQETANQATYQPRSASPSVGTLVPRAMRDAIQSSLDRVSDKHGDIDAYVSGALQYTPAQLRRDFSAEQVDALALAIDNAEQNAGFIIGDQTGVGKGRVVAAMIRYALLNGRTPIFVTEKPNLYADMIRDLDDIGMTEDLKLETDQPAILITNSSEPIPYKLIRKTGDQIVEVDRTLRAPATGAALNESMRQMIGANSLGRFRVIFTTYNQLQTVAGRKTARMDLVEHFADGGYAIFDESHNAGGTNSEQARTREQRAARASGLTTVTGRSSFVRGLVRRSNGSFFSSATYAKRPDVMDLYSSTNMLLAVKSPADLGPAIKQGGVPMQQIVATMLTQDGQYIRRERTFAGVSYETRDAPVDRKSAENMASSMRQILAFSRAVQALLKQIQKQLDREGATTSVKGGEKTQVQGANFGSIMHNLIDQMLLSLKVRDSVDFAIERLKAGEKVVLTVSNTMGSFLKDYAEQMELRNGDPIALTFANLYLRYLDKQRRYKVKSPGGRVTDRYLSDEDLGPVLLRLHDGIRDFIQSAGFGNSPISPIDYMHAELRKAGYSTDEITGRNVVVNYAGSTPVLASRAASIKQRLAAINGFNSGKIDALIINQSGATGLSLHASSKVADQRTRRMIIVQAEKNIDTHVQMLGRVHRTGQVRVPAYTQSMADIPAEARPAAVLLKKMASLSANTTASRKSAVSDDGVVDFMNYYGGQVVVEFLAENPDVHRAIGGNKVVSLPDDPTDANEDDIRKFTGYIPILPIEQQERVYEELIERYNDLLARENALGTNKLEARAADLDAETLSREQLTEDKGVSSVFASPAYMERASVKRTVKPLTGAEINDAIDASLNGATPQQHASALLRDTTQRHEKYVEKRIASLTEGGADAVRLQQERDTLNLMFGRVSSVLQAYPVGSDVTITDDSGQVLYGTVTGIDRSSKTQNPVAGSSWKMHLAIANGDSKTLTLPFNRIATTFNLLVTSDEVPMLQPGGDVKWVAIRDAYDQGAQVRREKRWIVTGNILAGYSEHRGQIITYTKNDGTQGQGVLMPRHFDYDKQKESAAVTFSSVDKVMQFLETNGAEVGNEGAVLKIAHLRGSAYDFTVPSARREGGSYYLDPSLTRHTGDFYKAGQVMRARVTDVEAVRSAVDYLMTGRDEALSARNFKDNAKQILGIGTQNPESPKLSRAAGRGATQESLRAALNAEFGADAVAALEAAGLLRITDLPPGNLPSDTAGVSLGGEIGLFAANTPAGSTAVAYHEALHTVLRQAIGDQAFEALMARMPTLALGNKQWFKEAVERIPRDTAAADRNNELAAYALESYQRARETTPKGVRRWVEDFLAALKAGLARALKAANVGLRLRVKLLSDAKVLRVIARDGLRTLAREQQRAMAGDLAPAFSTKAPPFYSALARGVRGLNMNASGALGWKAAIKGMVSKGQAKADEVEWSGVNEWLDLAAAGARGAATVEAAEGVDSPFTQLWKSANPAKITKQQVLDYLDANGVRIEEVVLDEPEKGYKLDNWLIGWAENQTGQTADLINRGAALDDIARSADVEGHTVLADRIRKKTKGEEPKFAQYQLPGGENYREVLLTLPVGPSKTVTFPSGGSYPEPAPTFRSGHWDQPNVLAHIRLNDRVDADGRRVLFVEEVQSDWQAAARKKGFAGSEVKGEVFQQDGGTWAVRWPDGEYSGGFSREGAERVAAQGRAGGGVPRAPFVDSTDKWLTLALKRVIKLAVDEGYDAVAFINGEQSADRYDLSKQVGSVRWASKPGAAVGKLTVKDLDGNVVLRERTSDPIKSAELEDFIGKDLARKLVDSQPSNTTPYGDEIREIKGLDLKVGGEGMRAFYDQIVPAATKALLKKVGGEQMETVSLPDDNFVQGDAQTEASEQLPAGTMAELRRRGRLPPLPRLQQLGFPITPKMREAAAGGLPMFARVWHGSPHTFVVFDASKIGTGEGAQSYGHGLYLADSKDVGAGYSMLTHDPVFSARGEQWRASPGGAIRNLRGHTSGVLSDAEQLAMAGLSGSKANKPRQVLAEEAESFLQTRRGVSKARIDAAKQAILDGKVTLDSSAGSLYLVDLPDSMIDRMLDWDAPLSEQAPAVRAAVAKLPKGWVTGASGERRFLDPSASRRTGGGLLSDLNMLRNGRPEELLRQAGIPGIKYWDGGSRAAGSGTRNYVIFPGEEKNLTILERNGEPVSAKVKAEVLGDMVQAQAEADGGGDQRMLFSRAGTGGSALTAQDLVDSKDGVFGLNRLGATKRDRIRTVVDKFRSFWLGALTRDQIADIYGDTIPQIKEYDRLTRQMENERSNTAQRAEVIYEEWSKLPRSVNDTLARIMLEATVAQVHPDRDMPPPTDSRMAALTADKRAAHARVKAMYDSLPPEGKAMYAKVRDFHADTFDRLKQALAGRISRLMAAGAENAALLKDITDRFDKALGDGPYFPLSRFGDYLVIATRGDGERVVASYETAGEQQEAARMLNAEGFKTKTRLAKQYNRSQDGAASKFIGEVLTTIDKLDLREAEINGETTDMKQQLMDDINQMFIRALPDLSYRKHFMHRKNTPGFSADVMRGFASSAFHAGSHIARLNHGDRMTFQLEDAFTAISQAAEMDPNLDLNKESQALEEITQRHEIMLNPDTHPLSAMATQFGFLMYLGLSPAAGLVNMMQVPMVTIPYLGARHGMAAATAAMTKAYADIAGAKPNIKSGFDAAQSPKLGADEKAMMKTLQDEGVIDLTQAHDLAAATERDVGNQARSRASFAMARAMRIVGWTFHVPEVMNRQATALMAFRLEKAKGATDEVATEAAREAIKRTQFDYSQSNRARYMQGNIARVVTQFKQFSQNMTYFMGRAAHQALKGETPEVRRIARKQLLSTLAVTGAMAGTLGLPGLGFFGSLIGVLVSAMDDDDEPWDWEVEYRNILSDALGNDLGEVVAKGIPRALMPWDISDRVSLADLWWRSNAREGQSPREAMMSDAANILGPTFGSILGWYTAADHMARGNYIKAVEAIVPKFIRDPLKAAREANEGITTAAGEPLMETTTGEQIGRLLGFAPARASEMFAGRNAVLNAKTAIEERRQVLLTKIAQARIAGDTDAVAEQRERIDAFNERNPEFRITNASIMRAVMNRRRNRENTVAGVMLPDTKESMREIGRFANVQ